MQRLSSYGSQVTAIWLSVVILGHVSLGIDSVHVDSGDGGIVVCESAVASRIGRDVLKDGGNAVDAAVATAFALAVSWPEAGNIGGGGFMIVRPTDGQEPVCIDYREVAPASMHATSFTARDTTFSSKAVGVPGTVRGLATAHQRFGKLPWKRLVLPAAKLANSGVSVDHQLAKSMNAILSEETVRSQPVFAELRRVYGRSDGKSWEVGQRLRLPDLARTLAKIASDGPDEFYRGETARLVVQEMERGNGEISIDDLHGYQAKVKPVLRGTYRGYTIIGAPPPSSGGTCVIQALNILENFDLASRDRFDPLNVHLIAETCRRVFADRARHLGDPDFTKIPTHLTTKAYAKELAARIDRKAATPSAEVAREIRLAGESEDTTHFSVVDGDRMAVSNTYTLEASWGSRVVVRGAGFVLNNEMGDFNWFPGVTNRNGRIGTAANVVEPGKRMLSSQSPTILERDGELAMVTGSPGGRTIINTTLCTILNYTEFGMTGGEAVATPRMHHQWFPDRIDLERADEGPHAKIVGALQSMGHVVGSRSGQGSAHTIYVDRKTKRLVGVSDYRRGGRPAAISHAMLVRWDFDEPKGTPLSRTKSTGLQQSEWSQDIADSSADGHDHFRIRRDAPSEPFDAFLRLNPNVRVNPIAVEVKIDDASFAGASKNEQLRIGFTNDNGKPEVTARMILGRDGKDGILIRGEALGGGTKIKPTWISKSNQLGRPIVLRLELDTVADTYKISSRNADKLEYISHGTGTVAKDRDPVFLRLSALNDFAANGEFVDVDRIELQSVQDD
ncbi:MAG: gamma-glutamyltransferase [Rubripirellula sp.]